jgi:organic radical activating enzyme
MTGVGHLSHAAIEAIRGSKGQSVLLFLTDRCPVGCAHCSVDSRRDSPTITDFDLFEQILDWIVAQPAMRLVGISGGEPFVERRGLERAMARFADAGLGQVVFTSGIWAKQRVAPWISAALAQCETVYLSTDAFHAQAIDDASFARAAQAIAGAGAWIVVQALDHRDNLDRVAALVRAALGVDWESLAEINRIVPLTNGRGAGQFSRAAVTAGRDFGGCRLSASPTIRYDGAVSGCCNESVLRGAGPARLRARIRTAGELAMAVDAFAADPMLQAVASPGLGLLTVDPRFADLGERRFASDCDLCWAMFDRLPVDRRPEPLLEAIAAMGRADA